MINKEIKVFHNKLEPCSFSAKAAVLSFNTYPFVVLIQIEQYIENSVGPNEICDMVCTIR